MADIDTACTICTDTAPTVGSLTGVHEPPAGKGNGAESSRRLTREESFARQQIQRVESMQEPTGTLIPMRSDGVNKHETDR